MKLEHRRAARLVVVDPNKNVFLFQYEDAGRIWWATPGGGLEGDETFEEAAAREATEEIGVIRPTLTALWSQTVDFTFRGQAIRQHERFFLIRLLPEDVRVDEIIGEVHRIESIVAARWWSLEDLETSSEQVFPEDLAKRIRALPNSYRLG
jgi:ADP-ribose pyrophosphatase YjhB (NUDIX family)